MSTITLHRVFKAAPDKIYRAFTDADTLAKWLPPRGFTCRVHHIDSKVGGTYKMSFTNFSNSKSHSFGGKYLELVPGRQLRYSDKFDDPNLPGEIITSVTIFVVSCGSDVSIVQENVPDAIPPELCYLGWQESLDQLAGLVEIEIAE